MDSENIVKISIVGGFILVLVTLILTIGANSLVSNACENKTYTYQKE